MRLSAFWQTQHCTVHYKYREGISTLKRHEGGWVTATDQARDSNCGLPVECHKADRDGRWEMGDDRGG